MELSIMFGIGILYFVFCLFLIINSIRSMLQRKPSSGSGSPLILICEIIFLVIAPAIGFCRFDEYGHEMPFSKHHVLIIILMTIISSASFWIARLNPRNQNPVVRILISAGMLQGIILCFVSSIHFIPFIPLGLIYPVFGFELL